MFTNINKISNICSWIIETGLAAILILVLFSYTLIPIRHSLLMLIIALCFTLILLKKWIDIFTPTSLQVCIALIFMFIFQFATHVKISGKFSIINDSEINIPLTVIILSICTVAWLLKINVRNEFQITENTLAKSILVACLFLLFFMLTLLPLLKVQYQMDIAVDLKLLNKILQIVILMFLVTDNIKTNTQMKRIVYMIIVSFSLTFGIRLFV